MKNFKKLFFLLAISFVMILSFTACGDNSGEKDIAKESKEVEEEIEKEAKEDVENQENKDAEDKNFKAELKKIKENKKLVVGTCADYPPYEFKVVSGNKVEIRGFDIDIARALANDLGVELEIKDMDFKLLMESLKQGQVDLVIAGLSKSPEREKEIDLSNVYYRSAQSILVKKENLSDFKTEKDLEGRRIGAQLGSIQADLAKEIKGAKVKELPIVNNLIADLLTDKLDAVIMEKPVAKQFASTNDKLAKPEIDLEQDDEDGTSIGVKKGNTELLDFINEELDDMINSGTIDKFVVDNMELTSKMSN